jgi:hypothetical protein
MSRPKLGIWGTLTVALLLGFCLTGCNAWLDIDDTHGNAVVFNRTLVHPIGSVFVGGGVADPNKGSSHQCHFYREKYTSPPKLDKAQPVVGIYGFRHTGTDYTEPGQYIDRIAIGGLDEAQGLGTSLLIPLNQGKYEGGNDLIRDVRILSYTFGDDADIQIVIKTTAGDILSIRYVHDKTQWDGYN